MRPSFSAPRIRSSQLLVTLCAAAVVGLVSAGQAAEVIMKSGFHLEGRLGRIAGLAENPLKPSSQPGEIDNRLIVLVDDGLRRTFVSTYQLREGTLRESEPLATTRIKVQQRVADGRVRRVGMVGPIVRMDPYDEFGRRILVMQTASGSLNIIQGITEVTPVWTKVEGLMGRNPYQWDMRVATSSIPRQTLSAVLMNQIDEEDVDERRQIVKLYIESERYRDASKELAKMFDDFPDLKKEMTDLARDLRQMSARRLLKEAELRQAAGQHHLVHRMLSKFPSEGVAGIILGEVSEKLARYEETFEKGKLVLAKLDENAALVKDEALRTRIAPAHEEIKAELNIHTLDRFGDFLRLADSPKLEPEQKVSLAISNWLMGSGGGLENLAVSLSCYTTRDLVREYLASTRRDERQIILDKLNAEEGATPQYVARLIAHMKPPVQTEVQENTGVPGLYELSVPSYAGAADITYHVQLPPEYDPRKRYPAVVTLNGSATTPAKQIDWWAGVYDERMKMRMGQAARRGYIVIAPEWTKRHQRKYEYSAREHAAVLFPLRDACKRFSIDTDRVFLSGHSMGGDAVWDIGLAHPDLWAGVVPIVATADKYVARYWENAQHVPLYFVGGEMDGDRMALNARDLDRYLTSHGRLFDCVVVEYLGRGHEDFIDEIQRIFDWMDLHRRDFTPEAMEGRDGAVVYSMRPWDNFFWWAELGKLPQRSMVPPVLYDERKDAKPVPTALKLIPSANRVRLETGAGEATIYLSPEMVNFDERVTISVNTVRDIRDEIRPQVKTILEDARSRGDRQHPFWAKVEVSTGRR